MVKKNKEEVVEETTEVVEVEAPEVETTEEVVEEVIEEKEAEPKAKEEVVTVKLLGHKLTGVVKDGVLHATDGCTYDMPKS